VALEPAYNALNSLALLNAGDDLAGLDPWVARAAAALTPRQRHDHRLVFEALGAAVSAAPSAPPFPASLTALAPHDPLPPPQPPLALPNPPPAPVCPRPPGAEPPARLGRPDPASLLRDTAAFLAHAERQAPAGQPIDALLHAEAHALLADPPSLRVVLVAHL